MKRSCAALAAAACFLGLALSQSTLAPTTFPSSTANENVSTTAALDFSTTFSGCSALNTSACAACAPGTHADNETLLCSCCSDPGMCLQEDACQPCAVGHFQPRGGQGFCLPCSQGFYSSSVRSSQCLACPAGSYSNSSGSESCSSCSPGFYTLKQNSTSCDPCPQGSFCNTSSCTSCQVCSPGSESLQVAAKECTPCRPGMYKTAVQNMCQICSSGFFQVRWGQESCDICPENHYCPSPDVNPVLCPNDAFCPEGSTAPGYCMETFLRKVGQRCELAPVTIALLVIGGGAAFLFVILLLLRRRRDVDRELSPSRTPLLRKERLPAQFYGAEPVYAGW